MGQKSSKKADLYVTDDVTHCNLPDEKIKTFIGRPREYTAIDVLVEKDSPKDKVEQDESPKKKKSRNNRDPHSIVTVLSKAHRSSYHLAFIIPKVKGSKPTTLARNSFIDEEADAKQKGDSTSNQENKGNFSHTIFLLRPKVKSRLKKEFSLKRMEATKTFLNVMMDIEHKWEFSVKEFSEDKACIFKGSYVNKLQEMISDEASKGGRLLSVMTIESDETKNYTTPNGSGEDGQADSVKPQQSNKFTLQMVFLHQYGDDVSPSFDYSVACHRTKCTEEALKVKKKQKPPKSSRSTNITWSENWLSLFKEDCRLTEVINVGEEPSPEAETLSQAKPKKPKPRHFEVCTLCFYEKPIRKEKKTDEEDDEKERDDDTHPAAYDGMIREVWAPIDENIQAYLENEASTNGGFGWELCTVLVTSHVRMKADGSEFRKCCIFFQRSKEDSIPKADIDKSRENLLQDSTVLIEGTNEPQSELLDDSALPPTSPKQKAERFGIPMMAMKQADLDLTKLKSTSKASPHKDKKETESPKSVLPAVQLKKINVEKNKKPDASEETVAVQQFKLRPTDVKTTSENKEADKEVPWINTLERKRKAVMKREETSQDKDRPMSGEVEGEIAQKIDEIKEKRADRRSRLSMEKKEDVKTSEEVKSDDKESSAKSNNEENIDMGKTKESKEEDENQGENAEPAGKVDEEKEEAEETTTKDVDDMPSPLPLDLPSPPPVVTPHQSNEDAIVHLYLPSPPPVTDDLSPRSPIEFPYPPQDNEEPPENVPATHTQQEVDVEILAKEQESEKSPEEVDSDQLLDLPPPPSSLTEDPQPTEAKKENSAVEIAHEEALEAPVQISNFNEGLQKNESCPEEKLKEENLATDINIEPSETTAPSNNTKGESKRHEEESIETDNIDNCGEDKQNLSEIITGEEVPSPVLDSKIQATEDSPHSDFPQINTIDTHTGNTTADDMVSEDSREVNEEPEKDKATEAIEQAKELPVGESADVLVGESDDVPVGESDDVPVAESDDVPVGESDDVPVAESDDVPVGESDDVPVGESDDVPVGESDDVPVGESDDVPVGESDDVPVGESDDVPVGESDDVPVGESDDVPVGESDDVPVADAGGLVTDKNVELPDPIEGVPSNDNLEDEPGKERANETGENQDEPDLEEFGDGRDQTQEILKEETVDETNLGENQASSKNTEEKLFERDSKENISGISSDKVKTEETVNENSNEEPEEHTPTSS